MKVILVMVASADGKTTMWHEPRVYGWSSPEDQAHFRSLAKEHPVRVMGRKTYEAIRNEIVLSPQIHRFVMTQRPGDFSKEAVPGQLEFTDEDPAAFVKRLTRLGYKDLLLVGGSEINEAFLTDELIDECILTLEPRFLGSGKTLFSPVDIDIPLRLMSIKKLNKQGTIVLHYTIAYDHKNG